MLAHEIAKASRQRAVFHVQAIDASQVEAISEYEDARSQLVNALRAQVSDDNEYASILLDAVGQRKEAPRKDMPDSRARTPSSRDSSPAGSSRGNIRPPPSPPRGRPDGTPFKDPKEWTNRHHRKVQRVQPLRWKAPQEGLREVQSPPCRTRWHATPQLHVSIQEVVQWPNDRGQEHAGRPLSGKRKRQRGQSQQL